jgi:RNA polymerase sigma-70 factor, ECF subfamily
MEGRDNHAPNVRDQLITLLPRVRRFCMAIAKSADGGDDLLQATVERALNRLNQYQEGTRLDSWLFRIAQNIHIDELRGKARRGISVDIDDVHAIAGDDGVQIVEGRSDLAKARDAMDALPDDQRALMALIVIDGQSYKQAAEILDIPIGTVMSRLARARRTIDLYMHATEQGLA